MTIRDLITLNKEAQLWDLQFVLFRKMYSKGAKSTIGLGIDVFCLLSFVQDFLGPLAKENGIF